MGKRVLFTQKEIKKYSKTYEGRQYMNGKRIAVALFALVFSVIVYIAIIILNIIYPIMKEITLYGCLLNTYWFIYGLANFLIYKSKYNQEEKEEINRRNEQKRLKELQNEKERKLQLLDFERKKNIHNASFDKIDAMNGFDFEEYCTGLLDKLGYNAQTTKKSGDFGADIIARNSAEKIVIQTKRYSKKVSISSVQEVVAAQKFYSADAAWIITNNYFTDAAKKLASYNGVKLIDRNELAKIIVLLNKS